MSSHDRIRTFCLGISSQFPWVTRREYEGLSHASKTTFHYGYPGYLGVILILHLVLQHLVLIGER